MNIFISANNTNQGKTYSTLLLMKEFAKKGYKVGAFKPIETGVDNIALDGEKLLKKSQELNPNFKNISLKDIVPIQMKLPAAPIVGGKVDFEKIKKLEGWGDLSVSNLKYAIEKSKKISLDKFI